MLGLLPSSGEEDLKRLRLTVGLQRLSQSACGAVSTVLVSLGMLRKNLFFQDLQSCFFLYAVTRKREYWAGDVALLTCRENVVHGYLLHIDRSRTGQTASVKEIGSADLGPSVRGERNDEDWDRERDRLFYELLGRMFERRTVVCSYLYGPYFDNSWAVRSFHYLTYHRHAFQGQNLFSKGACLNSLKMAGELSVHRMTVTQQEPLRVSFSMRLRLKGRETEALLIPRGTSWNEGFISLTLVPDRERMLVLTVEQEDGLKTDHVLRLAHFPDRPERATFLRVTLYLTSPDTAVLEAEDLGFGGFFPSTGRVWKREIRL